MPSNILCLQPCAKGFLLICPRLDAGTFGTMGVGTGFAIAAALLAESQANGSNPPRRVVCVQGDSAFGFSGMELETACRWGTSETICHNYRDLIHDTNETENRPI